MSETYTVSDVQKHKTEADGMWIIVENNVYDITSMFFPPPVSHGALARFGPTCSSDGFISRVPPRTPWRRPHPQAIRGQERNQGVLEVPLGERAEKVRRQVQDWDCGRGS